jgi:hypothetical protein
MTHHVIFPSSIDALQKSKLPSLAGHEHGRTIHQRTVGKTGS